MIVTGWTSAYLSDYPEATFTQEHRKALIERIRKRRYNFNYADQVTLPYCAPFFSDKTHCVLTKSQWDSVMNEAYKEISRGPRLMPMDVIEDKPVNGVLYEKKKFMENSNAEN